MRELAFLNKGIKIIFTDASLKKEKVTVFKFDGGVLEFVDFLDEKREKLQNKNGNDTPSVLTNFVFKTADKLP